MVKRTKKTLVIGLDCLTPQLAFDKYLNDMPTVKKLLHNSVWGRMKSTMPPITSPAWASMVTGKDPGQLGIYGFRNKLDYSYDKLSIVTSLSVKEKAVWDILGEEGKQSIVVAVPPSYPPKKIKGIMTGCFLTPDEDSNYAYPSSVKKEIKKNVGEYLVDVRRFRTDDKARLLKEIYALTENRFAVSQYLIKNKPWDFFMFVDMGPDRIHHGFWRFCDPKHLKFKKGNIFKDVIKDYYSFLDSKIADLLKVIDQETTVYIVSDHGAQRIDGSFCINEWLIEKGYLVLKRYPETVSKLTPDMVDWPRTRVWGEGGYYGRIFFNLKGRQAQGIISKSDYPEFKKDFVSELKKIKYINSKAKGTDVYSPEELYSEVKGVPPDLFVFFAGLAWRSAGTVGHRNLYAFENDTGPDDANHDYYGVFLMYDRRIKESVNRCDISIYDFAPTVLYNMGIDIPKAMSGKPMKIK